MEVKCFNNYVALTQATRSHFYALKKVHLSLARVSNHIKFLKRCKKWKVYPRFLYLRLPFRSRRTEKLKQDIAHTLLCDLLENQKAKFSRLLKEEASLRCLVFSHTDLEQWEILWDYIVTLEDREFDKVRSRQIRKFESLASIHDIPTKKRSIISHCKVVNLSARPLDDQEEKLLSKGLNFIPFNDHFSLMNIATELEYTFHRRKSVDNATAAILANPNNFSNIGSDNLSFGERQALGRLRRDNSICILSADKGKSVVVMDRSKYDDQLNSIVHSSAYEKVTVDPSPVIDKKIRSIVRDLKKLPSTPKNIARNLIGPNSRDPSIYGLPKLHKPGIPLRPIVSTFGSVFETSSKFIANILKFYCNTSLTVTTVPNSYTVFNNVRNLSLSGKFIMVSFDVINLFGSLNLDSCRNIIFNVTSSDQQFEIRFQIPHAYFMNLVDICLHSSFFKFKGEFFIQKSGVPMGSACSPVIADLYLQDMEKRIQVFPEYQYIKLWNRYMDDILSFWIGTRRQLDKFLVKLNTVDPSIQFSMELENDGKLPFLDIILTKTETGVKCTVYNKPTDSGLVLNFASFQPPLFKANTVLGEAKRYVNLSDDRDADLCRLREKFVSNGYPSTFVCKLFHKALATDRPKVDRKTESTTLSLPYLGLLSDKVKKKSKSSNIRLVSRNHKSLGSILSRSYKYNTRKDTNVIYEITCECGEAYVGETSKSLKTRITQHKYAVKRCDCTNGIAVHVSLSGHKMKWDDAEILDFEVNFFKRKIKEALFIKSRKPSLNLNSGLNLQVNWGDKFLE